MKGLERFQIVTSLLFVALGLVIFLRSLEFGLTPLVWIVCLGFVGIGIYRFLLITKFFPRQRN